MERRGTERFRSLRRRRASRRFRRSRRAVVSVVGTLLSLLVFFALFGVFITQYVPVWMTQNESQFSNQAQASMETLKQYVDDQVLLGAPQTYAVPFTMSSQGIPLFAQPTQGILTFASGGCSSGFTSPAWNVQPVGGLSSCTFQHLGLWTNSTAGTTGTTTRVRQDLTLTTVTDTLSMQLPNRYYPNQKVTFEDNAIAVAQGGGAPFFLVGPPLNISHLGTNWSVSASFLTLTGTPSAYASQGTKAVYGILSSNTVYSSSGRFYNASSTGAVLSVATFNVTLSVGTANVCAWYNYFNSVATASGLTPHNGTSTASSVGYSLSVNSSLGSVGAPTGSVCANSIGQTYLVALTLYNMNYARVYAGVESIAFSTGGL